MQSSIVMEKLESLHDSCSSNGYKGDFSIKKKTKIK